jgi:hypothetical protein
MKRLQDVYDYFMAENAKKQIGVMLALPMYGGMCTGDFALSLSKTSIMLHDLGFKYHIETLYNESLIMLMCLDKFPERKISKIKLSSYEALGNNAMRLNDKTRRRFDFIYIDGSHIAKDVLTDACMAWPLLKSGGIIVFDDYMWGDSRDILHRPKIAIDSFVNVFAEHLEVVAAGYQLAVRKK